MSNFKLMNLLPVPLDIRKIRIVFNENMKMFNQNIIGFVSVENMAIEAKLESEEAKNQSQKAENKADSIQTQFNAVTQRETDSDAMSRQAAVDVDGVDWGNLKARTDNDISTSRTNIQTNKEQIDDQGVPVVPNGRLQLPDDFPALPFSIFKHGYGSYSSDATSYNQMDWSDATEIFIKWDGNSSGTGTSSVTPIRLNVFESNVKSGVYGGQKKFILSMLDFLYTVNASSNNGMTLDFDADILFRPKNSMGYTWLGRMKNTLINSYTSTWTQNGGPGVYKSIQTADHDVVDVMNFTLLDDEGMPSIYEKVFSLSECQNKVGTFYRTGPDVYCHPYPLHDIQNVVIIVATPLITVDQSNARTAIFDQIGFCASAYRNGVANNLQSRFYFFNCKFHRGLTNAFYIDGAYQAYLFNCVASHATLDGFNYHATNPDSVAVEVNCVAYGSGRYKMTTGQPSHSNNGSTAHDGMYMLRVGSRYYECEGPVVADADNCYSISIGCEVNDIINQENVAVQAAYYVYDGDVAIPNPKYILECLGYGSGIDVGVRGTASTFVVDFRGKRVYEGDIKGREAFTW